MYQRCSTPAQARCHSEADLREAAKLSTSRRQNSDHGGPCSIRSRRRSASRRHLSRPSVSCFTDAEKNASLACASSLIERDCSTSMRKRFISMSSSFSSRRMTGNGSGASQGWGPRNGVMMTTFAAALIWRAIACRSVVYSWLRYGRTLAGVRQRSATFTPQKLPKAAQINSPWELNHWNCWRSLGDSNPCFQGRGGWKKIFKPPKPQRGGGSRRLASNARGLRNGVRRIPAPPSGSSPETPLHERGWRTYTLSSFRSQHLSTIRSQK